MQERKEMKSDETETIEDKSVDSQPYPSEEKKEEITRSFKTSGREGEQR